MQAIFERIWAVLLCMALAAVVVNLTLNSVRKVIKLRTKCPVCEEDTSEED